MLQYISAKEFLDDTSSAVILDVRSPGEFAKGHIPGAISFPLFLDDERAEVGTIYKQRGKTQALLRGLELIGPKLKFFAEKALEICNGKPAFIHCWRGGMRSAGMSTLLQTAGIECYLLKGGYKAYRGFILSEFETPWKFKVIGGKTGSGKTQVLGELLKMGEQVIDMEALARHKGSAFGRIGELPQPSTEQFGNEVNRVMQQFDPEKTVWIEDESQTIGQVFIPAELYNNYRNSPLIVLDIPFEERLKQILHIYGSYDLQELKEAFIRIKKKLGGQHVKSALEMIDTGNLEGAAAIALKYYDKAYLYGLENKDTKDISYCAYEVFNPSYIAQMLKDNKG